MRREASADLRTVKGRPETKQNVQMNLDQVEEFFEFFSSSWPAR
jgi:hypothetical protein